MRGVMRSCEAIGSLEDLESFEEPAGGSLAFLRDGVQEGRLHHACPDPGAGQALDALIEEGARKRARPVGEGDDQAVKARRAGVAERADGVYGVRAVLAYGEDVKEWGFGIRGALGLPEARPVCGCLREPGIQRGLGEASPNVSRYPAG